MRLNRLFLSNFLSFEPTSIKLSNRGLLLVSGKNGSGKSSLFSKAITWGLFGQTPDGLKGDSVIRIGETKTEVELNLDGLTIIRQRPHKLQFLLPNADDYIEYRNTNEAQNFINTRIQRDFTTFINADYFGQGRKSNFINESPKVQLEILEEILELNSLEPVIELTKKQIANWTIIRDDLKIQFVQYSSELEALSNQKAALHNQLRHLTEDLEKNQQLLKSQETKKANETIKITPLPELIDSNIEADKQLIDKLTLEINKLLSLLDRSKITIQSLKKLKKEIKDQICPTCDQQVDVELTNKLRKEQDSLSVKILEETNNFDKLNQEKNNEAIALGNIKAQANERLKRLEALKVININYDEQINSTKNNILAIKGKIDLINDQITKLQETLAHQTCYLEDIKTDLLDSETRLLKVKFWQNVFSKDFKNFVIRETLPFIEERTRYHLNLLNNSHIDVSFSTIKELKSGEERSLFNINFKVKNGGSEYSSLSGGEKQIASFAIGLTLSELVDMQNGEPSNIIILDEPFTELDNTNCENVINYLNNELLKKKETIILISNDDRMKSLVTNVLEIEKDENGISRTNE